MRFAFLSIVELNNVAFTSLFIYQTSKSGISNCIAEVAKPFELDDLIDDIAAYEIDELQTDSKEVYRDLIKRKIPVIYRLEIQETKQAIDRNKDLLIELFELKSEVEPQLAKWRLYCIEKLEKLIQILKTKGITTNGN